jgi:hypothetical protein
VEFVLVSVLPDPCIFDGKNDGMSENVLDGTELGISVKDTTGAFVLRTRVVGEGTEVSANSTVIVGASEATNDGFSDGAENVGLCDESVALGAGVLTIAVGMIVGDADWAKMTGISCQIGGGEGGGDGLYTGLGVDGDIDGLGVGHMVVGGREGLGVGE